MVIKQIYVPQQYGYNKDRKKKTRKPYKGKKKISKKHYYLRKSKARKPFFKPDRHVRKFKSNRNYGNKLSCFTCGDYNHLATNCPKRHTIYNRNSQLIEQFEEDLINIDDNVS